MRIVSLNAWGGQCWEALADWLPAAAPDVLLLQEVTRAPVPSPDWLTYRDPYRQLDQRADLFGDICRLLPRHQPAFAAAARGTLQDAAGTEIPSEHGLGTWIAPHLAVTASLSRFVHGAFRADGWGEEPVPRTAQGFRLADPATGRALAVAHMHGLRDPSGKGDTSARRAQAEALLALVRDVAAPGDPLVVAGDFNLLPGAETFAILARAGLKDLVTSRGHKDTRTALYPKPGRFADYCLVTPDIPVAAFTVPAEPVVSDHRPLILDLA
ncbi:endonuclease/exonuclease/phosphatase family protein [Pseudoroseicyclus sp. CXY001]|uniref:endonuclease/exonuclease/phosphatase family protein n=1 Tax=Pseudoroseicyclus sp. CXY001 TaxID=3242492 RepID=UPI003570DCE9